MIILFLYAFKVIICSAILYAYYFIALRNNKFHQWNRYYLLLAVAASLIIPALHLSLPFNFTADDSLQTLTVYTASIQDITVKASGRAAPFYFNKNTIMLLIYFVVTALVAARFLYSLLQIKKHIHHAEARRIENCIFINSNNHNGPCSFFKYIFWSPEIDLQTPHGKKILQHELVHVREKHSADKLIMEIVGVIFWFNPFFYLIKRELDLVHEFIADNKTSDGQDDQFYRELLLFQALNRPQLAGANYFFHHKIKRRIFMLTLSKQPHFGYLRRMLVLPLAFILLCAFSGIQKNQSPENNSHSKNSLIINQDTIPPPPPPPAKTSGNHAAPQKGNNDVYKFVEHMPRFQGSSNHEESNDKIQKFLHDNIRYPDVARDNGIAGTVMVTFVVTKDGSLKDIKTVGTHLGGGLEEEAIRVVKKMPKWIPGIQDGKKVNVQFTIPVRYMLD